MKETIKKSLVAWLVFSFTVIFIWISYAAYESITNVWNWDSLTSTLFNKVLENQRVFRSEIDTLNWAIVWSLPSEAVMAFNLSTCPTGWSPADGTNWNPDLRGTFVRWIWWDANSRDVARTLWNYQTDDFKSHTHNWTTNSAWVHSHWTFLNAGATNAYNWTLLSIVSWSAWANWYKSVTTSDWAHSHTFTTSGIWWTETRPKNIALLYCVKN